MSGPVAITGLACHFAPETRNLAQGGTAPRYAGGKCLIDWPHPEGRQAYFCEIRRLRPGKRQAEINPVATGPKGR